MTAVKSDAEWHVAAVMGVLLGLASAATSEGRTVTYLGVTRGASNYSDAGLDLGNYGSWFPQFNAPAPVSGAAVDDNDRDAFPAWVLPNFDPNSADYSFGTAVTSKGGQPGYSLLVLPDGSSGVAGTLVDPQAANNSNTSIPKLVLGAGVPGDFILGIVVDASNLLHDPANRIRPGATSGDGLVDVVNRVNTTPADFDGSPDVYSFRFSGWLAGDYLKLQLNSGVAGESPGISGLLFDPIPVVPEPGCLTLAAPALLLSHRGDRNRRARASSVPS